MCMHIDIPVADLPEFANVHVMQASTGLCDSHTIAHHNFYMCSHDTTRVKQVCSCKCQVSACNLLRVNGANIFPVIHLPMQWFFMVGDKKVSPSTRRQCGGLQHIRHKFMMQAGTKSATAVSTDLSFLERLENPRPSKNLSSPHGLGHIKPSCM